MRVFARAFFTFLLFGLAVQAQTPERVISPRVTPQELDSKLMARKMPYNVILPTGYSERTSTRYPVIYLLHGLYGDFNNWVKLTDLVSYPSTEHFIIVTPEAGNSWYADNTAKPNDKYESYIIKELIPEIDKRYRTLNRRDQRAIAGLSMGGYGAIKFGLKYPELFSLVGSFSGALAAANVTDQVLPGGIGKSIDAIFGPTGSELRKGNDPFAVVRSATAEQIKTFPFIYLDCGTEDILFSHSHDFVELLREKDVPHEYRELPGVHGWKYWNKQVKEFLNVAESRLGPN